MFYLDPPYWQTEGYGVEFPWEQYERLASMVRTLQGKAVISINDHPISGASSPAWIWCRCSVATPSAALEIGSACLAS
ncbi:hypothetical protein ACQEPW_015250 [Xanthomonas oryzae pv. oryzicola]|uniref:hypothetical protein n=1 Tax=Xanthomonas oryzae TaxID=347 RepID=UPI003F5B8F57